MKINQDERGVVSIVVTTVLMIVISLTVLAFAQIIRREQREALDSVLSTQAFYAAETGVNDARRVIKELVTAGQPILNKTQCESTLVSSDPYRAEKLPMQVSDGVRYSCLLIDGSPKELLYNNITTTSPSRVVPIASADGSAINKITLSWTPADTASPTNGCPADTGTNFTAAADWTCGYGMPRIDLVPIGASFTRLNLMQNTFTSFLMPINGGSGAVSYGGGGGNINGGTAQQGVKAAANCSSDKCTVDITGLGSSRYYARISTIYKDVPGFKITANDAAVGLTGAQVKIDATGRAQDVLRRVQVNVPLVSNGLHSDYGIQTSESICKRLVTPRPLPDSECNLP